METKTANPRKRRTGLVLIATGAAGAALALAILPAQLYAPGWTGAALQTVAQSAVSAFITPAPVRVGPALPVPLSLQGTDAATLHRQALIVGAQDPQAAVIGFARAALRGDSRAAFYLGQHFEAGDGVPRNAALATVWYASAAETQRSALRALQRLSEAAEVTGQVPTAPPLPLTGQVGADNLAEFVWAAPAGARAHYLIELADAPDAPPHLHGPYDLSAALLDIAVPARLWRVVSIDPDGARIGTSDWHQIDIARAEGPTPGPE